MLDLIENEKSVLKTYEECAYDVLGEFSKLEAEGFPNRLPIPLVEKVVELAKVSDTIVLSENDPEDVYDKKKVQIDFTSAAMEFAGNLPHHTNISRRIYYRDLFEKAPISTARHDAAFCSKRFDMPCVE